MKEVLVLIPWPRELNAEEKEASAVQLWRHFSAIFVAPYPCKEAVRTATGPPEGLRDQDKQSLAQH